MYGYVISILTDSAAAIFDAARSLVIPSVVFALIALAVKGREAVDAARRALPETRTTLTLLLVNILFVVPLLGILATWLHDAFAFRIISPEFWEGVPLLLVALAAVICGDFAGYWRHRLEHTGPLWPSHAVHHSDTEMTWLAIERFHPINRITTFALDSIVLLLLGFPPFALLVNNFVRHHYGAFVHADLPWTYGKLGRIFVSPAMHRWHHAADPAAFNTNYATVFSAFDRMFGTYRVPGPCHAPLGVTDEIGQGSYGQLAYPFRLRAYRRPARRLRAFIAAHVRRTPDRAQAPRRL